MKTIMILSMIELHCSAARMEAEYYKEKKVLKSLNNLLVSYLFAIEVRGRDKQMSKRRQVTETQNQDLRRTTQL